ncbi:MAG: hypothetical protein ICV84_03330 [Flavisolibacter sp.]|nr:hypothetical protein [Flavisolibacter sp.]
MLQVDSAKKASTIWEHLHRFIEMAEEKKIIAIYTLFEDEIEQDEWEYTDEFKQNWTGVATITKWRKNDNCGRSR